MKNKSGLSTIIVTLILIVISLAAIGVFWLVVRNIINSGSEQIGIERFLVDAEVRNVQVDGRANVNNISLTLKRKSGSGDLTGIKFVFVDNNNAEIFTETFDLDPLEERRFHFHLNSLNVSNVVSISIVPLITTDDGDEILGDTLGTYKLKDGTYSTNTSEATCVSTTCAALGNYECGTWSNGTCGTTFSCGSCSSGYTCTNGLCVAESPLCTPATNPCGSAVCGTATNGTCGTISCGSCLSGYTCTSGSCVSTCTPTTCSALGYNCGSWANGTCSGNISCGTCSSGYSCISGTCSASCTPTTCSALGYVCGTPQNGTCSGTLNCGTCQTGYQCVSGTCVMQTSGLVAYYPFTGNANDESGNGLHGTVSGATLTTDRNGNANSAYLFDGINDYIRVENNVSLNPSYITISVWIKPNEVRLTDGYLVHKGGSYFIDAMRTHGNTSHFYCYNASTFSRSASSNKELIANSWNHLAATFDGTGNIIYLNGVRTGSNTLSGVLNSASNNLMIGTNVGSNSFNGTIDEIRIYNYALSSSEVASLYASG